MEHDELSDQKREENQLLKLYVLFNSPLNSTQISIGRSVYLSEFYAYRVTKRRECIFNFSLF